MEPKLITLITAIVVATCGCWCKKRSKQNPTPAPAHSCGEDFGKKDWEGKCRNLAQAKLARPDTAEFSYMVDVIRKNFPDDCEQYYFSTVESKNRLGITAKSEFACTLDTKSGKVQLRFVRPARH